MLDIQWALITDLGHANWDEPDLIMTKIREESAQGG
jgi:hypothetical protein